MQVGEVLGHQVRLNLKGLEEVLETRVIHTGCEGHDEKLLFGPLLVTLPLDHLGCIHYGCLKMLKGLKGSKWRSRLAHALPASKTAAFASRGAWMSALSASHSRSGSRASIRCGAT